MIELIFILGLAGLGVFLIFWAADDIVNDFLERVVGILGIGAVFYAIAWFIRWLLLGGLVK